MTVLCEGVGLGLEEAANELEVFNVGSSLNIEPLRWVRGTEFF